MARNDKKAWIPRSVINLFHNTPNAQYYWFISDCDEAVDNEIKEDNASANAITVYGVHINAGASEVWVIIREGANPQAATNQANIHLHVESGETRNFYFPEGINVGTTTNWQTVTAAGNDDEGSVTAPGVDPFVCIAYTRT